MNQAAPRIENDGGGSIPTVPFAIGYQFGPNLTTRVSGDSLTVAAMTGLDLRPVFSTVGGTSVNFGTIRGVHCQQPSVGLFETGAGTETMTGYIGLDMSAMPFAGNVEKVAVRSALAAASNSYFLRNLGTAQSNFNNGNLFDCGYVQILSDTKTLSLGASGGDMQIGWNGDRLEYNPLMGSILEQDFSDDQYQWIAENFGGETEAHFGFDRWAWGQLSIGNQIGIWVAPAFSVDTPGEWVDFLFTSAGNLDLDGNSMSTVSAAAVNARGLTLNGGSAATHTVLRISGNPGGASDNRVGLMIQSNPSGASGVNAALWVTAGRTQLDGAFAHGGSTFGLFGQAPTAQAPAYTPTNVTSDRSFDADTATVEEIADVLGTLIADLQSYGLLQ